jgi:hypothetical protein
MSKLHMSGKHQHRVETKSPEQQMSIADGQYIIQFTTGLVTIWSYKSRKRIALKILICCLPLQQR